MSGIPKGRIAIRTVTSNDDICCDFAVVLGSDCAVVSIQTNHLGIQYDPCA
jgi:hypothetical protein